MFEKMKANKKAKAEEKKARQISVTADTLESANARRVDARQMNAENTQKLESAKWHEKYLDAENMRDNVAKMRTNLFIQKDKLCRRIINANKELAYIKQQPENLQRGSKYFREIKRCQKESKESYYALDVVMEWIDRIDSIENEYEWRSIMKDLTASYKVIHEISDDTGLLAKLAFLINNFRLSRKGQISFEDMEEDYQKDVNELLDYLKTNDEMKKFDIDRYIYDNVYELKDEDTVYESIEWGTGKKGDENEDRYDSGAYNNLSNNYSESKPAPSGETERNDNYERHSEMNEPAEEEEIPTEFEEIPARNREIYRDEETNFGTEIISENEDFELPTDF